MQQRVTFFNPLTAVPKATHAKTIDNACDTKIKPYLMGYKVHIKFE